MKRATVSTAKKPVVFERSYDAPIEVLWDLWTTKDGFESWWGPEGFRVDVHTIEPRVGGTLFYDMIAVGDEQIAYMKSAGMALSHETRGTFVIVEPLERLKITHVIDFLPGLDPYDNSMLVEFAPKSGKVRMTIILDPHPDHEWTRRAAAGLESQLTKVPAALAARHQRS